jgi:hypothetical protein
MKRKRSKISEMLILTAFLIGMSGCGMINLIATASIDRVHGKCELQDLENHSGISIKINGTVAATTNSNGDYEIQLSTAMSTLSEGFRIRFEKNGYLSQEYKLPTKGLSPDYEMQTVTLKMDFESQPHVIGYINEPIYHLVRIYGKIVQKDRTDFSEIIFFARGDNTDPISVVPNSDGTFSFSISTINNVFISYQNKSWSYTGFEKLSSSTIPDFVLDDYGKIRL